jgi:hypothetical protein
MVKRFVFAAALALMMVWSAPPLLSFCGCYCAKADSKLFNKASQVVLVRDGDRTVMTMVSDFQGDPKEFALVVPVPTVLQREQIHVGDKAPVEHLDAYSAPRLVEYFDGDPCKVPMLMERVRMSGADAPSSAAARNMERSLGVTIEARYTVGEYDILILSAVQSTGLQTWLRENGYVIPPGASDVIGSYVKQNMKFFVAKVNLTEQSKLGFTYLRPLQIAYESPKFMLPIRLGMVNADKQQELFVYALTRKGRVETTNYRTVKMPSDMDLPVYLKQPGEFAKFYQAMFRRQVQNEAGNAVFVEYAWDMRWCDPCAADPLSNDELRALGVFWAPVVNAGRGLPAPDVFVTRLHVSYDKTHFPEDLVFQETGDRSNFQGRYVLRHGWTGEASCAAAGDYRTTLRQRQEAEANRLATLTGWDVAGIRKRIGLDLNPAVPGRRPAWWERLWNN